MNSIPSNPRPSQWRFRSTGLFQKLVLQRGRIVRDNDYSWINDSDKTVVWEDATTRDLYDYYQDHPCK